MKHLFVTSTTYGIKDGENGRVANLDEINLLHGGAMAIFDKEDGTFHPGTVVGNSTTAAALTEGKWYDFVVAYSDTANADDTNYKPDVVPIKWTSNIKVSKKLYTAPAAKVIAFGDDINSLDFGSISANSTYTIVIEDREKSIHDITRKRYYTVVSVAGDTATTLVTKLVNKISADSLQTVTPVAISGSYGIKFTGAAGKDFGIQVLDDLVGVGMVVESANATDTAAFIDGIYYDTSTDVTLTTKYGNEGTLQVSIGYTPYTPGYGTVEHITAIEREFSSHKGDTKSTYRTTAFYNAPTNIVAGDTYTVYTINFQSGVSQSPMQAEGFTQTLVIATKGTINNADLDKFFGI